MGNFKSELSNYQNVPRELVFDKNLSDRARFVYVFMACKPDGWDFYLEPMAKDIGYSVDTLRKYINELVTSGWLIKGKQTNEKGVFGAVEYTLKATKKPDTENLRHGKKPTQDNRDKNIDILYKEKDKEEIKELKEKFTNFVSLYKQAGGKVRGVETEFRDFSKRHKDWQLVVPYLELALQREIKERNQAKIERRFFPEIKMLKTYLGQQRAWEMYVTIGEKIDTETYTPQGRSIWFNEETKSYWSMDNFYDEKIYDGYDDNNRPNGAKITLNNARGTVFWNANTKKWEKVQN